MIIEVESLGFDHRNFYQLRDELIAQGKKFDARSLPFVSYEQLALCCTGEAGVVACSLKAVREEKQNRRERFLGMVPEELEECIRFLQMEQMFDDVKFAILYQAAPAWASLSYGAKAWTKLNCVFNHLDDPLPRLAEVIQLLGYVIYPHHDAINDDPGVPPDVADNYRQKLKNLIMLYPGRITDKVFREKIVEFAENILDYLPEKERKICEREELQDYSCTNDCFRVLI